MPVKAYRKTRMKADKGLLSTTGVNSAALVRIKPNGTLDPRHLAFSLNPESYTETKKSNWVPIQIPGQSDPVFQWVAGDARTITFDGLVTRETSEYDKTGEIKKIQNSNTFGDIINAFGSIAGSLFGTSGPKFSRTVETCSDEDPGCFSDYPEELSRKTQLSIHTELNYYRSLLYPEYDKLNNPARLESSPPLLAFFSGGSFNKIPYGQAIGPNTDVYILTDLKINVTKQLPNLDPMEAILSFTLVQYNVKSFSGRRWDNTSG